ncbi:hypothetical protein QUB60_15450 [Microcoleus sp. A2-C5]|uniref:hypothetical protein n=1 Tax=Microcoleaceae TaxID=1892252 RepID=UPI0022388E4D|nr:hypothetical protein [Lyngbya sp. CCAP 1446/10]MCW6049411.1 hypothetical protein [Lyngbya sp. CCAP 1446/10]
MDAIAPDSATLANPQADGIAILSLTPNVLPDQVETKMSLSPDWLELLLDRIVVKKSEPVAGDLRTEGGNAIESSTLIAIDLKNAPTSNNSPSPQALALKGFRPRWLP